MSFLQFPSRIIRKTDVANHLISDRGLRSPTGYADTFQILEENSIVDDSLRDSLRKMAKFRNVVVHQYEGVDAGIVLTILKDHLVDFEHFRGAVLAAIQGDSPPRTS